MARPDILAWPMRALGWWLYELEQAQLWPARAPSRQLLLDGGALSDTAGQPAPRLTRRERIRIALPAHETLTVRFELPLAVYLHLPRVLALRADAAWPIAEAPPAWDATLRRSGATLEVALTLARPGLVEHAVRCATALGARKANVAVGPRHGGRGLDLAAGTPPAGTGGRFLIRRCLLAIYAPLAVAAVVQAAFETQRAERAAAALNAARKAAQPALEARSALVAKRALADLLRDEAAAHDRPTELLATTFAALPAATVLSAAELDHGGLVLRGIAPNPAQLLARVEATPHLVNARLSAPIVRDPTGGFRFEADFDRAQATEARE